jgi:hypothetical protein
LAAAATLRFQVKEGKVTEGEKEGSKAEKQKRRDRGGTQSCWINEVWINLVACMSAAVHGTVNLKQIAALYTKLNPVQILS